MSNLHRLQLKSLCWYFMMCVRLLRISALH
nr:MAG TPA_asm: hypothetical protein [Caudoviricetes sp.]